VQIPKVQAPNRFWGQSDLQDVIPIDCELDDRLSDEADVVRHGADPPAVFKGATDHSHLAG
jgi:hypothetical protein